MSDKVIRMDKIDNNGWNRSSAKKIGAKSEKNRGMKTPTMWRGLAAGGAIAILVVALCAWLFFGDGGTKPQPPTSNHHPRIKEGKPVSLTNKVEKAPPVRLSKEDEGRRRAKELRAKYGDNMPPGLKTYVYYLENPPKIHISTGHPYAFLSHPSERRIASLIQVEPGTEFIEKPEFGEAFNQDFINAMLDKIEIKDDDSDKVKRIKEGVTAAKKEISELCKADGKKPSEVMNEFATSLYELGRYRQDLESELATASKNGDISNEDVQDYYRAANELLKKKGLEPLKIPSLKGRAKRLEYAKFRAEKKAARAAEKENGK